MDRLEKMLVEFKELYNVGCKSEKTATYTTKKIIKERLQVIDFIIETLEYATSRSNYLEHSLTKFKKAFEVNDSYKVTQRQLKIVANVNTKIYHIESCPFVRKINQKSKVYYDSVELAKKNGYKPCEVCQ